MIVDISTWTWLGAGPWASAGGADDASRDASPAAHDTAMHCVSVALVCGYESGRLGVQIPARFVRGFVEGAPDRRAWAGGVDPLHADASERVQLVREQGGVGVVLSPADQGCRPTSDACLRVLEACAATKTPVFIHNPGIACAQAIAEFADPLLLDEAMRTIPGLTVTLGDAGRCFTDRALLMAQKHKRLFVETGSAAIGAWSLERLLRLAHERGVAGKVLFGSGFPASTPERAIEMIYGINRVSAVGDSDPVPREVLRSIVERDALACLGIDPPPGARPASTSSAHAPREGAA